MAVECLGEKAQMGHVHIQRYENELVTRETRRDIEGKEAKAFRNVSSLSGHLSVCLLATHSHP